MKCRSRHTPTRSPRRSAPRSRRVALAAILLACWPAAARAQGPWDPAAAAIPWSGAPAPVDGRTSGGALSPYGSHVGLAAVLDPDAAEVPVGAAAAVALHDGRASRRARLAAASLVVEDAARAPVETLDAAVAFEPWGWTETSRADLVDVRVRVFFVNEDAFVLALRLDNGGAAPRSLGASLVVAGGRAEADGADALLTVGDATVAVGGGASSILVASAGPPARVRFEAAPVEAGGSATFALMLGFGADADEARRARDGGLAAFATRDPEAAWAEQESAFAAVDASASCSEVTSAEAAQAHRLAVAALRSSAYAPRGALGHTLLSADKGRDNGFLGSDLPRQAEALASWDPEVGLGALLGQLDALASDSHVPYRFDEDLVREPLPNGSLPPVQAQALAAVARWGAILADEERTRVVRRLEAVAAWWPTNRDFRGEGLLVHGSPEEAGRPGSPRWPVAGGASEAAYFEAPDLSATYVEFLETLATFEEDVVDGDPETLRLRAARLRHALHEDLWDEDRGAWLDRDTRTGERSAAVGPFVLAPLAAGLAEDDQDIARVLDETLLRPEGLWGDDDGPRLPVPAFAYDAPGIEASSRPTWLEDVSLALRALSRHGRRDEAARLVERVLAMVAAHPEGLYDRYFAGAVPDDAPPALQAGRAAAELLGILHGDHERERTILPGEASIEGRIAVARFLGGARLVDLGSRARLPHLSVASAEADAPLEDADELVLTLTASCDVAEGEPVEVALPALGPFRWFADGGLGSGRASGTFTALVGHRYRLEPLRLVGGGCACRAGTAPGSGTSSLLVLAGLLLVLRRGRPGRD